MASGSGKKGPWGKPGTESSEARDRLAFDVGVGPPLDAEAFQEAQSRLRLPNDPASLQRWFRDDREAALECLQRWFHEDPKAALEWVTKARVPALVPALVDLLQDEAITHFHMAEALEQIGDEHDRTRAIKIKRSEEAQVESFPQRAITSAAEDHEIREHLERGELREAFRINGARAAELIIEDPILHFSHANRLTPLLREQAGVQLLMALALASIAGEPQQKSRALATLFAEAAQTTDRETLCFALRSLKSFEALTVIPGLIAYLQEADDGPPRDAALETFEHLIVHGLAADASDAARRARDLTLRCFVALLGGAALDEQERVRVVGIVLRRADVLGGELDAVIGRMAELSNVTVEEMGLRVCGQALARLGGVDETERAKAAGWIQRHLSGEHAAIPTSAFASQSPAAQTSEGSIESPRAPIHRSLTDVRSPRQTSPVSRMDASQRRSTTAPSPEPDQVDLGSQSFGPETARTIPSPELESGEDFPAARSDVVTTGVYTDQLDLSSLCFSFTTSDPTVLRTRMLLLTVPDEDPSQLDVLEHGKWVLKRVQQLVRQLSHQCIYDAQQYLDRLKKTDFADYSADQRRQVADTVKRLAKVDGFTLQCREASSKDCKTVTNVRSNLSNDRSKGTFRVSSGSHVVTTDTPRGHFPQLCAVPQEEENEATHADTNSEI